MRPVPTQQTSCSLCGAQLQDRTITFVQTLDGDTYLVTDVPAQVCPQCGETYLTPDIVDALQGILEGDTARPQRIVEVPVYRFPAIA